MLAVMKAKNEKQRKAVYLDLLTITDKVLEYASAAAMSIKHSMLARSVLSLLAGSSRFDVVKQKGTLR